MGIFKKIKTALISQNEQDGKQPYPYLAACKDIWKRYVPDEGPSTSLQGELLRETEALRYEAQNNGNFNWDSDFAYFCDFIKESLCAQDCVPDDMKAAVAEATARIKACGEYGRRFNDGLFSDGEPDADAIPDDELDVDMIACVDDAPYDVIENAIGLLDKSADGPIPYERNPSILR